MEQKHHFNATYLITEIMIESMTNFKATGKFPNKKWHHLHLDNARRHT
jgi:hypothetical protein